MLFVVYMGYGITHRAVLLFLSQNQVLGEVLHKAHQVASENYTCTPTVRSMRSFCY